MKRRRIVMYAVGMLMGVSLIVGSQLKLSAQPPADPPAAAAADTPATPAADAPAADAPATPAAADAPVSNGDPTATADSPPADAAPADDPIANLTVAADTMWVMLTGMLVFFMNLGFACVESGFCRAKNTVNILSKNFIVFSVTTIGFWLVGWGLMFGNHAEGAAGLFGTEGMWMVSGSDNSPATGDAYSGAYGAINWAGVPLWAKFFFQLVFAATAATIVSGAVAERIKYHAFIIFSFIMAIAIYPIVGHWIWGGGILGSEGFLDFAGSTQVHSIGGWAALAGMIVLGPRLGKYSSEGKINAIPGHNLALATIGCLILWFGWYGFNPGSTMAIVGAASKTAAEVAVTTTLAAAAGTLLATATAWLLLGKPDLGMTLNGALAGLVAITAPCAFVGAPVALLIGGIAGVIVVLGVLFFDRMKIDDPVGATSVHLLNGIFGTIAVGLFATADRIPATSTAGLFAGGGSKQLLIQLKGIAYTGVYVFVISLVAWLILKATIGIRVGEVEEHEGLDHGEHGNEAYHGFQMVTSGRTS